MMQKKQKMESKKERLEKLDEPTRRAILHPSGQDLEPDEWPAIDRSALVKNTTEDSTWDWPKAPTDGFPFPSNFDPDSRLTLRRPVKQRELATRDHPEKIEHGRDTFPDYCPVILRGASGEAVKVLAFLDTGAEEAVIHSDMLKRLGGVPVKTGNALRMADHSDVEQYQSDTPIRLWAGDIVTELHMTVLSMDRNDSPYILLGRRFMRQMGIHLANMPFRFPSPSGGDPLNPDFIDINDMESKRLTDVIPLSQGEIEQREILREHVARLLRRHDATVPVNSFIDHPDAVVRIFHEEGVLPVYIDRPKKAGNKLDDYIEKQIQLWLTNGKLIRWDRKIHGAWPRYNMPLVPVVTKNPHTGEIIKVRVCVDARGINMGIVGDDTPIPNIQNLYAGLQHKRFFSEFDMVSAFNQFPV
jgi:hypothetical protein